MRSEWAVVLPLSVSIIVLATVVVVMAGPSARDSRVMSGLAAIAGGHFQASGVTQVPHTREFLFVDDDSPGRVFMMELTHDGRQSGSAVPIALDAMVTDPEGMTWDGRYFYIVGSQSKPTGFDGDGLVRFTYDAVARETGNVERIVGLKHWLARHVQELRGAEQHIGDHVLNIEGLAWDSAGRRLLLGLRAPVIGDSALIIPVQLADTDGAFSTANLRLAGPALRLSLGGAGIRSIEFDSITNSYYVITGASLNAETLDFHVMRWRGDSTAPELVATYDKSLKPEGLTVARFGERKARVLVFDTGRLAVVE